MCTEMQLQTIDFGTHAIGNLDGELNLADDKKAMLA